MRLCEEYLVRNSLKPRHARHTRRGFLYFEGGEKLLCIEWMEVGAHPGLYEFSECHLGRRCRTLSAEKVLWDDYESRLLSWKGSSAGIVFERDRVFSLTWEYFMRRHEDSLLGSFPLSRIHSTVDPSNPSRLLDCMSLLDDLQSRDPQAADFWHSRAFDIVHLYCHWAAEL